MIYINMIKAVHVHKAWIYSYWIAYMYTDQICVLAESVRI